MGRHSRHRTGLAITLIEIIVALTLLITLMALSAVFFTSAWRKFHAQSALQDAQTNGIIGIDRFGRDFRETSITYVTNNATSATAIDSRSIYFPSPRDLEGRFCTLATGEPDWKTWVIYTLGPDPDHAGTYLLFRKKMTGTPTFPPSLSDVNNKAGAMIMAHFISNFEVTQASGTGSIYSYNALVETLRNYKNESYSFKTEKFFSFTKL
jgi:type II secretory pathway pseudopilin PulG